MNRLLFAKRFKLVQRVAEGKVLGRSCCPLNSEKGHQTIIVVHFHERVNKEQRAADKWEITNSPVCLGD